MKDGILKRLFLVFSFVLPFFYFHAVQAKALDSLKPSVSCASLQNVDLEGIGGKGSHINSAKQVKVNGAEWCQIDGVLAPEIGFQMLLPSSEWNQRYMQIGCGGLCGRISLQPGAAAGCSALDSNGFALATTDMGHKTQETDFGKDRQKRSDFAWRAQHLTAITAKKLISVYYKSPPAWSYFNGCSDGGREALMEAQRFPNDFNGIIAGAEAMNFQVQNALYHSWQVVSNKDSTGHYLITGKDLTLIHKTVLSQCDALDGQEDGLIADPEACHPDLNVMLCKTDHSSQDCLSTQQISALRKLYEGPKDPITGEKLTVGGPQYGSELAWNGVFIPKTADSSVMSESIALPALRYMSFIDNPSPEFALKDLKFDLETFRKLKKLHPLYDATNPNLSAFYQAGGKLIIWHGWADPHISPINSIAYHDAIGKFMGDAKRQEFERLYLLPGVWHCSGGEGPSLVDFVTPIMQWVEDGHAPDKITTWQATSGDKNSFGQPTTDHTSNTGGIAALNIQKIPSNAASRPVYPYPFYAVWSGHGDVSKASSYIKKPLSFRDNTYRWAGKDFYSGYKFIN
ncbi:tannase/feruloyl esterase family alpha/beta hydrolase [Erwinia amylovora]